MSAPYPPVPNPPPNPPSTTSFTSTASTHTASTGAVSPDRPVLRPAERRLDHAVVALGVALLSAAVVVSVTRARSNAGGDLDATVFLIGVGATLALLGFGLAARVLVRDRDASHALMSWPLAFGSVGAGLMVALGLDDGTSTTYIAGAVVIALAAGSYLLVPSAPPAVAGILGVLAVYSQGFTDAADFDVAEDNGFKTFAVAVLVFVVIVTAIGWLLPPARTTVAVVVGVGAVIAYTGILAAISITAAFAGFASFDEETPEPPSFDGDVYTTFAMAALMVAGWTVLAYLTDSPGFRVLVVAMVATVFPAGIALLAVEHPTGWGFGVGLLGAVVLAVVGLRAMTRSRRTAAPAAPTAPTATTTPAPPAPPY